MKTKRTTITGKDKNPRSFENGSAVVKSIRYSRKSLKMFILRIISLPIGAIVNMIS